MENPEQVEKPEEAEKEKPKRRLTDDELIERIAQRVTQQHQPSSKKAKTEFETVSEELRATKAIGSEFIQGFQHDELNETLGAFLPFKQAVDERILAAGEARAGIYNAYRGRFKTKVPVNLVLGVFAVLAVIAMFSFNDDMRLQAGAFFSDRMNQIYTVAFALIGLAAIYFITRRRRSKRYA